MKKLITITILTTLFMAFGPQVYGLWVLNEGSPGKENAVEIDNSIIEGASNFLQAHSQLFLLLNQSEISTTAGFDFDKAGNAADLALEKINAAKEYYANALASMKSSTFDPGIIQTLTNFDYTAFAASRDLHPYIMQKAAVFLSKGDVPGLFEVFIDDLDDIAGLLKKCRDNIKENTLPELDGLRNLFQKFSDCNLLGYYAALVFYEIKK